nr:immunoglobulin light chain junction region [Macaca mulatta]MOW66318.1 immunoglobulin light chain junction region [Macaca mulatta]MOW67256.1 immunoglobulin light chain junction region [Macaca mulatta]MOW67680.1 immunoglobulin light chain junction region [Macaca mulatta]MOW69747.1 immunoglobulin light chain junction region [Macaca mulatta]
DYYCMIWHNNVWVF